MGEQIAAQLELAELPRIDTKSAEAIRERIKQYFDWCIANDTRPHVEQMALALHVSRQSLWNWRREGGERGEVIEQAVQVLASLHEGWGITGKLNPAVFIFVGKNHFGYRDSVEIEAVAHGLPAAQRSPAEIEKILSEDIPQDIPEE